MRRQLYLLISIVAYAVAAAWAVAQPTPEELTQQRHRVAELRKQPEQLARLRENLNAFLQMPEKRRDSVEKLDRELRDLPAKKQHRLSRSLERYADWLEQLREKNAPVYQAIKNAPDATARLALIKEQRDHEWIETQPRVHRDEWSKLAGDARATFILKLRESERQKHEQWLIAKRFWRELETKTPMPIRLSDFSDKSDKVRKYVEDFLMPTLSPAEKKQLADAEGRWPDYPQTLVAIASKRPAALPPEKPRRVIDLPDPVRKKLTESKKGVAALKLEKELKSFEGPNFASNLVKHYASKQPFEYEYLASNYNSLQKPMKEFVDKKLMPELSQAEQRQLSDAERKWPEYPETIQELAKKHQLSPPWLILPEPERWKWDLYRNTRGRSWGSEVAKEKEKKIP